MLYSSLLQREATQIASDIVAAFSTFRPEIGKVVIHRVMSLVQSHLEMSLRKVSWQMLSSDLYLCRSCLGFQVTNSIINYYVQSLNNPVVVMFRSHVNSVVPWDYFAVSSNMACWKIPHLVR